MDAQKQQEFKNIYRKEKDPQVTHRMLAVYMVCVQGKTMQQTADDLMYSLDWVQGWISRYKTKGLDGIRDL